MNLGPAFAGPRGFPQPLGGAAFSEPAPENHIGPTHIRPVRVTEGSAGNKLRLGIVTVLYEYARWRGGAAAAGYPYFVANPEQFTRVVNRRLARPRRMSKVLPNTRGSYTAPMFGGAMRSVRDYTGG